VGAIFGLIGDGTLDEVRAMGQRMSHRGVDSRAWSPAPRVYFGTRGGNPDAVNGRLAADAQLDEISDEDLETALSDGPDALRNVHGYFSIAYWDDTRSSVLLACDTSGFKSLYYTVLDGRIAFASEYKAFLALGDFHPRLDRDAAQYYLATLSFRMDRPLMSGVHPLIAGTAAIVRPVEAKHAAYWRPLRRLERRSPADFARVVQETLMRVVKRQARRFTRVGVTLSGGLDSACVLAALRRGRQELEITSYTIGFGADDADVRGGRELARLFGTQHRELFFELASIPQHLPRLVWLMEDCTGREESLLQYRLLSTAAQSEKVIFGGYGADYLFGGMPRYRLLRMREVLPWLRTPLTEIYQLTQTGIAPRSWLGRLGKRLLYRGRSAPPPAIHGAGAPARVREDIELDQFLAEQLCDAQDSGYLEAALETAGGEFRDPFQSTEMMDLALAIPAAYNVGLWRQKKILRRAVAELLPAGVAARGKSLPRLPHDLSLSRTLDEMADTFLSPSIVRERDLVAPAYVETLRARPTDVPYSSSDLYHLWSLLCLEIWQRHFIDGRGDAPASSAPLSAISEDVPSRA
jgi:asparagine synthase (glutamine-hydrolysing)